MQPQEKSLHPKQSLFLQSLWQCTCGNRTVTRVRTPEYGTALMLNLFHVNNSKWTEEISVTTFAQLHFLWYINQRALSVLLTLAGSNSQSGAVRGKACPFHGLLIPAESGIAAPGKATKPSWCFFPLEGQISASIQTSNTPKKAWHYEN